MAERTPILTDVAQVAEQYGNEGVWGSNGSSADRRQCRSERRAKLNGLDSPASVVISPNVRGEMERALSDLQQVLGMVADDRAD
jgi:hypothetical protein